MKIWIHQQHKKVWYRYWKPTWLNSITYKKGDKKIYRWLFWGFSKVYDSGNMKFELLNNN